MPKVSEQRIEQARAIVRRQDRLLARWMARAPLPPFATVARHIERITAPPLSALFTPRWEERFSRELTALMVAGGALAAVGIDMRTFMVPGLRASFASQDDDAQFVPEKAVAYWKEKIPLTDEQASLLLENLNAFQASTLAIAGEYSQAVMNQVAALIGKAIREGMTLPQFKKAFAEIIPGKAANVMETIFRTNLSKAYGAQRYQFIQRSKGTLFVQYLGVLDDRIRPTHRAMHGYISAKTDPLWLEWTPPNGWQCRCDLSPIPYLEAIRRGIAAYGPGGKGLVLTRGIRPYGPPKQWVLLPNGTYKRVAPDLGFGAAEKQSLLLAA
jgi:SPP1 gp7 family putative phage head morphogenesis protein